MAHFAHVNSEGIVDQVLVIDEATLATGHWGDPSEWVQTSYNVKEGTYKGDVSIKNALDSYRSTKLSAMMADEVVEKDSDMEARNRKNYAGVGYSYDKVRDAFIPPQPFKSWTLNEDICQWEAPTPFPNDGNTHSWNEELLAWESIK